MRILLFSSAYAPAVGGVEELTRRLAERLTSAGDVVEVWTQRFPATLAARETIAATPVRRFALPMPRMDPRALAAFPPGAATALLRLRRAGAALAPDVVHVQCFSANGIYATALAAMLRVPLVVTLQGETVMDDSDIYEHSHALRAGLRAGLRRADAVTGCSRFVLDDAERRFGLAAGRGLVVPNGVDGVAPGAEVALELPFERFVLGLGRVVEKKGFDLLLAAFARLAAAHPQLGLVIGGDGAARSGLARRARELGLGERVRLPGALSREQVGWAMANADVFVLPSRVEPFGIVVLEALRAGRPVVVSANGGAGEIVRNGREGLLVDPHDTAALATAIARLLDDEALAARLAAAGVVRAGDYSWEALGERYRDIYRAVVAARR